MNNKKKYWRTISFYTAIFCMKPKYIYLYIQSNVRTINPYNYFLIIFLIVEKTFYMPEGYNHLEQIRVQETANMTD